MDLWEKSLAGTLDSRVVPEMFLQLSGFLSLNRDSENERERASGTGFVGVINAGFFC